jgi:hypothetical protein
LWRLTRTQGALFGDKNIANHWYNLSEEERAKIHDKVLHMGDKGRDDGLVPEKTNGTDRLENAGVPDSDKV